MKITPARIAEWINQSDRISLFGKTDIAIEKVVSLTDISPDCLSWIKPGIVPAAELENRTGFAIVCDDRTYASLKKDAVANCYIVVENPKLIFSKIVNHFFPKTKRAGIHPTAFIEPGAVIGEGAFIGPLTYIGNCRIGNDVTIHGHCHIYDDVTIGSSVTLHAGTVIGSDGFGYSNDGETEVIKFPHIGGVIIEDDVEIGANTCIDRGALGNTIIKKGAKIDNLVHIAHNVVIEENAFIIANAMIGGSATIGKNVWVAPSVSLLQQRHVGNNALIGMGAVVLNDIPPNEVWAGAPAKKLKDKSNDPAGK